MSGALRPDKAAQQLAMSMCLQLAHKLHVPATCAQVAQSSLIPPRQPRAVANAIEQGRSRDCLSDLITQLAGARTIHCVTSQQSTIGAVVWLCPWP